MAQQLRSAIEQLNEYAEKRDEAHFSFIRQVLLMASGILGLVISLHSTETTKGKLVFQVALLLLCLGIVFLTIALAAEYSVHKKMFLSWKDQFLKMLRDPNYHINITAVEPGKIYKFFEVIGYIFLAFAIIGLTIYVILI